MSIKRRVTKKDVERLKYLFRSAGEAFDDLAAQKRELQQRLADLLMAWNAAHAADLDVLRRYGCTTRARGCNIHAGETVGLELPPGAEVEVIGRDGIFGPDPYPDFYVGGDNRGRREDLPGMREIAEKAIALRAEHKRRHDEINAWLDTRPLRREVAARHPELARRMWPDY